MVTWIVATWTAALTLFLTVGFLVVAAPIFDAFDAGPDNPAWAVAGAAGVVVALSSAADVVAVLMLRGNRWARWALVGLSMVSALGGVISSYYIAPLAVTAAASAVVVLLLVPDARAWFRRYPDDGAQRSA